MPPKNNTSRINALLGDIGQQLLDADPSERLTDSTMRVEHLPIQLVRPDPVQPRRVLPEAIHIAFHQERLTPYQALREFIQLVQVAARQHGRPFTNILELLPNHEQDEEQDVKLTPEEELLRDLVNLAVTIRDDGQVNPLTVVDRSQGVSQGYQIETGERRYWATWLLIEFLPGYQGNGSIPCIIIPSHKASVFRQAKENTSRAGLNAIAMARQAALLILYAHSIERPEGIVSNDFYRQALDLTLRDKREFTAEILSAMGGISRTYFSRYKNLLNLSDEALELADRYSLDEYRLRPILALAPEHHIEVVRQIIDFNLSSKQVQALCQNTLDDEPDDGKPQLPRYSVQFAKSVLNNDYEEIRKFIDALVLEENNPSVIKLRWQSFVESMNEILENI